MANTTSLIWNSVPNPAAYATVIISNNDVNVAGVIEIEVFLTIEGISTPVAHEQFAVPPLINYIRVYGLIGASAYEIQYNVTGTSNFSVNIFPTDVGGNFIGAQRVLGSETQEISQLTPIF
ncbi:hypothetical protein [Cohnella soli]|uniref:Uncharacterized protein n=1 Tax=Cohnella soli TaxID=425005 RepID=A0ABW0HZ19_9BACL